MRIPTELPRPPAWSNDPAAASQPKPVAGQLPPAYEELLSEISVSGVHVDYYHRVEVLDRLIGGQGVLTHGWLAEDSAQPGPVIKRREQACAADGVVFGEDNLGLDKDVLVLGMRDAEGGADSYFLCQWSTQEPIDSARFFIACVESGRSTGRFEIYVRGPLQWDAFLDELQE